MPFALHLRAAGLCLIAVFVAFGLPWISMVHAAEHRHAGTARPTVTSHSPTADHDERDCVVCQLLASAQAPADLVDGPALASVTLVLVTLDPPFARGLPAAGIAAAPWARGPPSSLSSI
jgi:hypothetical protein